MSLKQLATEQREALRDYRTYCLEQGETRWKGQLKDDWLRACYFWTEHERDCYLQQIRNQFGPTCLNALKASEFDEILPLRGGVR